MIDSDFLIKLQISVIDRVKYRKIHEEVMKKLDKLENEFLPQVMVDATEIIFDLLKFLERSNKDLIIANTGQVRYIFCSYRYKKNCSSRARRRQFRRVRSVHISQNRFPPVMKPILFVLLPLKIGFYMPKR